MIVDEKILNDLLKSIANDEKENINNIIKEKRVNITKLIYDDKSNFELSSVVEGLLDNEYNTYIKIRKNKIENIKCTCAEYEDNLYACKHIMATIMEFNLNSKYLDVNLKNKNPESSSKKENHRAFKQLINQFYNEIDIGTNKKNEENELQQNGVRIVPKLIYNAQNNSLKLEVKIGNKTFYKIKSLPEFFERMLKKEVYKYGNDCTLKHVQESFDNEDKKLLEFIVKYGEIIKYANEASNNYGFYARKLSDSYIFISNTGIDEIFDILKNKTIEFENQNEESYITFVDKEPEIYFELKQNGDEYILIPNIDIYSYSVFYGKKYIYFLINNKLYKCNKLRENDVLQILNIYKKNFTSEVKFSKNDLNSFFSIVYPLAKDYINLDNLSLEDVQKFVPKDLEVKVYLDYDKNSYISADIKFVYGNDEFNPIAEEKSDIPRDVLKESESLDVFKNSGFMLDVTNGRLILTNDDLIYSFLTSDIEIYMQKFEVLATENFKTKEIKQPKIASLGVKIENNLLNLDLSNLEFDSSELINILEKYKLKKKYYRLKDGSFLNLQDSQDLSFKELEKGNLKLPIFRSLYLNNLLNNLKNVSIIKDDNFKKVVNELDFEKLDENNLVIPKSLNAELRNYQKIGYIWLKNLDSYGFGGILADDMGLGKTIQLLALILDYKENNEIIKPSIVVAPSSLTLNWQAEINKFAKILNVQVIHGSLEERQKQISKINNYDIVITSYDLLKRDIDLYKEFNYEFQYIIADEAQYIKNNNTQNSKAIKEINAKTRFALTGTPIENSLSELWSIFDFIMPGYLFSYRKFKQMYETPIIKENDTELIGKLKKLISPFILRRVKKEVLTELPDKTITVLSSGMQGEQLDIYMSYLAQAKKEINLEIKNNGFENSKIKILALLMRLRQICCHPSLFIENYEGESSKLNQCMQITKDAVEART